MGIFHRNENDDDSGSMFSRMFGPKSGTWGVSSKLDPRWNKSDKKDWLCTLGRPPEAEAWLKECEEKFGEYPKDLEYSFFKD